MLLISKSYLDNIDLSESEIFTIDCDNANLRIEIGNENYTRNENVLQSSESDSSSSSSDSGYSSDEDRKKIKILHTNSVILMTLCTQTRRKAITRTKLNWNLHSDTLLIEGQFKRYYRMSHASFEILLMKLAPIIQQSITYSVRRTKQEAISPENKFQMTLRWLAGGSHHTIRAHTGVSVPFFYARIREVMQAINNHDELKFDFPDTENKAFPMKQNFKALSNYGLFGGFLSQKVTFYC